MSCQSAKTNQTGLASEMSETTAVLGLKLAYQTRRTNLSGRLSLNHAVLHKRRVLSQEMKQDLNNKGTRSRPGKILLQKKVSAKINSSSTSGFNRQISLSISNLRSLMRILKCFKKSIST